MTQRWKILAALTAARTAMGFQFQAIAAGAPFLAPELGLDKTQLGWLIGLYLLPGIVIALPGGLLGARFGDRRVTLIGLALMAAGGLWLAHSRSFAEASAARMLAGAGAVVMNVLLTKMVADWFEGRDRLLAMSVLINAWPIGIGLALLLVGPMAQAQGWPATMLLTAGFAVAGFVLVAAVYRAPPVLQQAAAGLGLSALSAREWLLLLVASLPWMSFNAAYQILVSFLPAFFLERGSSVAAAGATAALNTVLVIVSVQGGGLLLKRMQRPDLLCHAALIGWSVTVALLINSADALLWIVLGGLVVGLPAGLFVSLGAEVLRPEVRAAGMGVFYTVYYFGCALFPAAAGALYDATGRASSTLWLAVGCALACIPALLLLRALTRR